MADLEKIYELTIENNTNIKHLIKDSKDTKIEQKEQNRRLVELEYKGRKTLKEHMVSITKVCGAFIMLGSAYKFAMVLSVNIWQ